MRGWSRGLVAASVASAMTLAWSGSGSAAAAEDQGPFEGASGPQVAVPAPKATPSVADPAVAPGAEVISQRSEFTKTFATAEPGVLQTRVYQVPVHFRSGDKWVSYDTRLQDEADGDLTNARAPFDLTIASKGSDDDVVSMDLGRGRTVGWSLAKADDVPRTESTTVARFDKVRPGVDMKVRSTRYGVKEDLVLDSRSAPRTYTFPLNLTGLRAVERGGQVVFVDDDGDDAAVMPAGFMEDAAGAATEGVSMSLVDTAEGQAVKVTLDSAWLDDPARKFPVTVDPSVHVKDTGDTQINSGNPDYNYAGWTFMRSGLYGSSKYRSLLKFNLDALAGGVVENASLNLYNEKSETCTPTRIYVKTPLSAWFTNTVGWPGPDLGATVGQVDASKGGPGCDPGYVSVPVTGAVSDIVTRDKDNWGFAVTTNETATSAAKTFTSLEEGVNEPYLNIKWRQSQLGVLPGYTFTDAKLTDRLKQKANIGSGNLVMQAPDVNLPGTAGHNLTVARYYNSRAEGSGMFGAGWVSSIGQDVRLKVTSDSAEFTGPSGYRVVFDKIGTGSWAQPRGLNATLSHNTLTDDYAVRFNDTGVKYRFHGGPGAMDEIRDKNGNSITLSYTSGKVTKVTDTHGEATTLAYGSNGKVSAITDPRGRKTTYEYNGVDLTASTDQDGNTTRYAYDGNHNLTSVTDPNGNTTRYAYDDTDRLREITWADSTQERPAVTKIDLLPDSSSTQKINVTDPRGNTWKYQFDERLRLKSSLSPRAAGPDTKNYDDATDSVLQYTKDGDGTTTLTYDGYNVKGIADANGATSTFDYADGDAKDRPSKYTDPSGVGISYDWNAQSQLTDVKTGDGANRHIEYQSSSDPCPGVIKSVKDGNDHTTTFGYTGCNLTKIDRPAPAGDSTMTYDTANRLRTMIDGKGNKQVVDYNAKDQVTKITYYKPGASTSSSTVTYAYDKNGNRTERVDTHGGSTKTSRWTLDARNRVSTEDLPGDGDNSYAYDVAGNLTTLTTPAGPRGTRTTPRTTSPASPRRAARRSRSGTAATPRRPSRSPAA